MYLARGLEFLRHKLDAAESGAPHDVNDRNDRAPFHILVGPEKDIVLRAFGVLLQSFGDIGEVDPLRAIVDQPLAADRKNDVLFRVYGGDVPRLGQLHVDAGLKDGRRDHEYDEQHEHHVDQRRNIDVSERTCGAPLRRGECHQLKLRSTRLRNSAAKSSISDAMFLSRCTNWLYPITAGIAAKSPAAVVMRASAMPGATA